MDEKLHGQAVQELVKKKFRGHDVLLAKYTPKYPISVEREYQRIANQYMRLFKECITEEITPLKEQLMRENGTFREDGVSDVMTVLAQVLNKIGFRFKEKEEQYGLRLKLETLANLTRKLTIKEWKKAIGKTLGVDIMEDYYLGDFFKKQMDSWITENVDLIKSIPHDALGEMKTVVKDGFSNGRTITSIMKDIQGRYNVSRSKASLLARDQTGKLSAKITKAQQEDAGIEEYIWSTAGDGRVRKGHKKLNGERFRWDNPPIVDERTGRRCHPSEDYQCRCIARPVFSWQKLNAPLAANDERKVK